MDEARLKTHQAERDTVTIDHTRITSAMIDFGDLGRVGC